MQTHFNESVLAKINPIKCQSFLLCPQQHVSIAVLHTFLAARLNSVSFSLPMQMKSVVNVKNYLGVQVPVMWINKIH